MEVAHVETVRSYRLIKKRAELDQFLQGLWNSERAGIAIEAGILENPWQEPPEDAYVMTRALNKVPKKPRYI